MSEIAQQQTQVSAPAGEPSAPHGGSSAVAGMLETSPLASTSPLAVEGHGQDPAQDGAQTGATRIQCSVRPDAEVLDEARVRIAPAPAQAAGGAAVDLSSTRGWKLMEFAPREPGTRVVLWDGIMRIGTRRRDPDPDLRWEADEGGFIKPTLWYPVGLP